MMQGYKTYLVAVAVGAVVAAYQLNYINEELKNTLLVILGAGGAASLAAKINRVDKKLLLVPFLILSLAGVAHAQVSVPRGSTYAVEFNSDSPNTTAFSFKVWVDKVVTKTFVVADLTTTDAPLSDCFGTATPPTGAKCLLFRGIHPSLNNLGARTLWITVTDTATGLMSAPSPSVVFNVTNPSVPPNAPTNPRVVVVTTQAGVTFEFKSAPVTVQAVENKNITTVKIPVK